MRCKGRSGVKLLILRMKLFFGFLNGSEDGVQGGTTARREAANYRTNSIGFVFSFWGFLRVERGRKETSALPCDECVLQTGEALPRGLALVGPPQARWGRFRCTTSGSASNCKI